jgi:hypothetical protein
MLDVAVPGRELVEPLLPKAVVLFWLAVPPKTPPLAFEPELVVEVNIGLPKVPGVSVKYF